MAHLGLAADKTIVTMNGDILGGSLIGMLDQGYSMLDLCAKVGVNYVGIGNHEFDIGRKALLERIREFPGRSFEFMKIRGGSKYVNRRVAT